MAKFSFIVPLLLVLSTFFWSCDKDFFKNKSFVECNINNTYVRGEGLRGLFEPFVSFHMNYSYNEKDTFTFNIDKQISDGNNKSYNLMISISQNTLPAIGRKYYFKHQVNNDTASVYIEDFCVASIQSYPYLSECADTSLVPKEIRKKRIAIRSSKTNGFIEFSKLDILNGDISGVFEFEAEGASRIIQQASHRVSVTNGRFEGYHLERNRTFYTTGLSDYFF